MLCVVYRFLIMTLILSRASCKLSINVTWQKHILSRVTLKFSFSKATEKRGRFYY